MDNSSLGNPYKFHSPIVASSTKNEVNSNPGVTGTPLFFISDTNKSLVNRVLNSELNGPQYEINAVANDTFPTNLLFYSAISDAPLPHLSFSSDNDPINYLAVLIFFLVLFDLISN